MNHQNERKQIKQALDQELSDVTFSGKDSVLSRTHPKTRKEKLDALWNREVQVPLIPLGAAMFLMITAGTLVGMPGNDEAERELIERGGSYYWSDMIDEGGPTS
ncbi:hypothetical protein [Salisediminibacterium beveridgei]|uniref:Uncharacterized protein n=1 Tax=Salisediminibacterium beveridgei TaxID=632773 RepID=A0A1D7QZ20_9BACI|nr:hypothetical protein [Salisediminibacterium beveridgei]AOM84255.1 hypothetical protein BBEV_2930 [Salisediminibacterium beveridgei]